MVFNFFKIHLLLIALLFINIGSAQTNPIVRKQALILIDNNFNESSFKNLDIHINSRLQSILTIDFAEDLSKVIQETKGVLYMEQALVGVNIHPLNDIERTFTSVDRVNNGSNNGLPKNFEGKGVIIGIVDVGFQNNNPNFFNKDGTKTRISRFWHQGQSGTPPIGYNYGNLYTDSTAIINANDLDGSHGTHVAGIAAGSGFSTPNRQYRGVAPEAELVFVSIKYSNDTLRGSALGDYVIANPSIIDAYKYIFDYAASVGKPAVINLSWGMHTGPHDGTSLFDIATEQLVGNGKIIVGANGNDGENPMHLNYKFNKDTVSTLAIENNRQWRGRESIYCDFWGSKNSRFGIQVQVLDTHLQIVRETPFVYSNEINRSYTLSHQNNQFKISFQNQANYPLNNKPNITLSAESSNRRLYIFKVNITSDSAEIHAWNSGAARDWTSGSFTNKWGKWNYENSFINGNSNYTAGENGGTSKAVISVGASAARSSFTNIKGKLVNDSAYAFPGSLASFSSRGPTVDGRIKPNIVAPGFNVPSSYNNLQMASWMSDRTLLKTTFRGDTQYWAASSGTSMAAPHATGIVALMLEANPNLNAYQVMEILEQTATEDQWTGSTPNNNYGHGKVNAYEAVLLSLQYAGINAFYNTNNLFFYPNPSQQYITFKGNFAMQNASISIYNTLGALVMHQSDIININSHQINIQDIADGIYTVVVKSENSGPYVFKLLKR
jgi:subtilisin family serine protease